MVESHWEPLTPRKLGKFSGTPGVYMCLYLRNESKRVRARCSGFLCLKYLISLDLHLNVGTFFLSLSYFYILHLLDQCFLYFCHHKEQFILMTSLRDYVFWHNDAPKKKVVDDEKKTKLSPYLADLIRRRILFFW